MRALPRMAAGVHDTSATVISHISILGAARGAFLLTAPRPLRPRRVQVKPSGARSPMVLRTGTSDIRVAFDIWKRLEYGWSFRTEPQVILDAGAYTGLSAAWFATRFPQATVIAVEPDPENFELLTINTAAFPNVRTVQAALWKESGTVQLADPGRGPWSIRVAGTTHVPARAPRVRAVTVPEIMDSFGVSRIDLLKMDIESAEVEVFANSSTWLPKVTAICIELHDRLRPGCSRAFYTAVTEFEFEARRGEDVLVARAGAVCADS